MAILIDTPRWPAHGTIFGHLVSDHSLVELHRFARLNGLPLQAFDHDHFDVPERRVAGLIEAGAEQVPSRELVTRLSAGGLRVRRPDKLPAASSLIDPLRRHWADLLPEAPAAERTTLGEDLLAAWSSPTRHYHDPRHLWSMLAALDTLQEAGAAPAHASRSLALAAWFHDAVYDGIPGQDEESSAQWAERALEGLVDEATIAEVARLVRLTTTHSPDTDDPTGQTLSDADLCTLAGPPARYWMYARAIRIEYSHVDDDAFRAGRSALLRGFLATERLFHTEAAHQLWDAQARTNLAHELSVQEI